MRGKQLQKRGRRGLEQLDGPGRRGILLLQPQIVLFACLLLRPGFLQLLNLYMGFLVLQGRPLKLRVIPSGLNVVQSLLPGGLKKKRLRGQLGLPGLATV